VQNVFFLPSRGVLFAKLEVMSTSASKCAAWLVGCVAARDMGTATSTARGGQLPKHPGGPATWRPIFGFGGVWMMMFWFCLCMFVYTLNV